MVKVELKVNGTKIENFRYRSYAQKVEVSPAKAAKIVKAFEAILDGPEPVEEPKKA